MFARRRLVVLAGALILALPPLAASSTPAMADPLDVGPLLPIESASSLPYLSGMPMLMAAESMGITEVHGKNVSSSIQSANDGGPRRLIDVAIGNDPVAHENEPSIATSTKDKKKLVAGSHLFGTGIPGGTRCAAYTSSDGGATWSRPFLMPQLPGGQCSDPVLAYAPDGSRVFYAHMDIKPGDFDIVVNYSDDDGATWLAVPIIALNGGIYDKPWIATPLDDANYVYVTATFFSGAGGIHFTRSTDKGVSYGLPTVIELPGGAVVQGSRPSGGKHGELLVAWYNSGLDGWLLNSFQIRTRWSGDFGATFAPMVVAATDTFEAHFWLDPAICYHRWWGSMFPDVEIDNNGSANIVYTHDPTPASDTEAGDVRYVSSSDSPYSVWSRPVTVNDDGSRSAQGYAALDTQTQGTGQSAVLHAMWEDHRLSAGQAPVSQCPFMVDTVNLLYDQFYSRKPPGEGWQPNLRVTERSSLSDFIFIGDYVDLTTDNGSLYGIFTDRRDKLSIMDPEDDVYGSRIIASGGTP